MSTNSLAYPRAMAALVLACSSLAGCGGPMAPAPAPTPTQASTPTPTPPIQYAETPAPFGLTQSRTFDILDWDAWTNLPTPSAIQFRWDAALGRYEVLAQAYDDWSRLEAVPSRFGGTPLEYDVFARGGTKLPFYMVVWGPPFADVYVGIARIIDGNFWRASVAFGIATEPADVPVSGIMRCSFGEDEVGGGELTFDLAAGTVSGWAEPFWANVRYQVVQNSFAPGATTFAAPPGSITATSSTS